MITNSSLLLANGLELLGVVLALGFCVYQVVFLVRVPALVEEDTVLEVDVASSEIKKFETVRRPAAVPATVFYLPKKSLAKQSVRAHRMAA